MQNDDRNARIDAGVSAAAAAAVNDEEIDIDGVDEDSGDSETELAADDVDINESAAAGREAQADESMFAPVEMHNYDPTGASAHASVAGPPGLVPEALANALRQHPQ